MSQNTRNKLPVTCYQLPVRQLSVNRFTGYRLLATCFLFSAVYFLIPANIPALHAAEVDERYLSMREEEIRVKQERSEAINEQIQSLNQQISRERDLSKQNNEKIWKEYSESVEVQRKEFQTKLEEIRQKQALFERELERKNDQDVVRIQEKELAMKRMMLDFERLRRELDEDKKTLEQARSSYQEVRKNPGELQPPAQASGGDVLESGSVRVASVPGNHFIDNTPMEVKEVHQEYHLVIGDVLQIEVWKNQDLSKRVTVRPDGRISLPLSGDIPVVGVTLVELREIITKRISNYIRDPQVTISIEGFGGRKFIMLGEISSPGVYRFQDSVTLMEAIALAGGFTKDSHVGKIMIIRGDVHKTPQVKIIQLNAANILKKGILTENVTILPNDIIYLGRDFVGDYRDFFSELIDPAVSRALDFFVLRSTIRTAQLKRL